MAQILADSSGNGQNVLPVWLALDETYISVKIAGRRWRSLLTLMYWEMDLPPPPQKKGACGASLLPLGQTTGLCIEEVAARSVYSKKNRYSCLARPSKLKCVPYLPNVVDAWHSSTVSYENTSAEKSSLTSIKHLHCNNRTKLPYIYGCKAHVETCNVIW